MMYKKTINDKVVIKPINKIVIKKDGMCTYNPNIEDVVADGWEEYVEPDDVVLKKAIAKKLCDLEAYDSSSEVNDCIIMYQGQELHYWANKTERDALKGALRDCISMGRDTYRLDLREKGLSITLPCELLLKMMAALEVYAIDCYNKTTDHEFAINSCETEAEVNAYDFKVGYPEKLRFEV